MFHCANLGGRIQKIDGKEVRGGVGRGGEQDSGSRRRAGSLKREEEGGERRGGEGIGKGCGEGKGVERRGDGRRGKGEKRVGTMARGNTRQEGTHLLGAPSRSVWWFIKEGIAEYGQSCASEPSQTHT